MVSRYEEKEKMKKPKLTEEDIKYLIEEAKELKIKGYKKMKNDELLNAVADAQVDAFLSRYE